MKKPIIGIIPTFNKDYPNIDPYKDIAYFIRMYSDKIAENGGIPFAITTTNLEDYMDLCDGYLWPGGHKVNHEYYPLVNDAIENNKPFLGICLGAQALSIYFNMLDDKKRHPNKALREVYDIEKTINPYLKQVDDLDFHKRHVIKDIERINAAKHDIDIIDKNSIIYNIFKTDKIDVVSLHGYEINRTPENVKVTAKKDNVIEAIEYRENNSKILGVQFHPEILDDNKIFEWLIDNCNKE